MWKNLVSTFSLPGMNDKVRQHRCLSCPVWIVNSNYICELISSGVPGWSTIAVTALHGRTCVMLVTIDIRKIWKKLEFRTYIYFWIERAINSYRCFSHLFEIVNSNYSPSNTYHVRLRNKTERRNRIDKRKLIRIADFMYISLKKTFTWILRKEEIKNAMKSFRWVSFTAEK